MKEEFIEPFYESIKFVLQESTGFEVTVEKAYPLHPPFSAKNVVILIGLIGSLKGQVFFTANIELVRRITAFMVEGIDTDDADDLSKSALSEISNMIVGHTTNTLCSKGINVDLTPPTILTGENLKFSTDKLEIVCVPIAFDDGSKMDVIIAFMEPDTHPSV